MDKNKVISDEITLFFFIIKRNCGLTIFQWFFTKKNCQTAVFAFKNSQSIFYFGLRHLQPMRAQSAHAQILEIPFLPINNFKIF